MLPCGQDFESAVAEFDHVFSRIPPRTSQDEGRFHLHPALNEPRTVIHSFRPKMTRKAPRHSGYAGNCSNRCILSNSPLG